MERAVAPAGHDALIAALERLRMPMAFTAPDGAIQYLNDAMGHLLAWDPVAVVGRDAIAIGAAPADTSVALEIFQQVSRGEPWFGRFPVQRGDGSRMVATVLAVPVDGSDGEPGGVLSILLGVDPEEQAQLPPGVAGIEESNRLLEGVLENAPVALGIFDRDLRYVRANPALAEINGFDPEDHVGARLADLLTRLPDTVAEDIASVFRTGEPVIGREVVGETPARPGEDRTWVVSYYPIHLRHEVRWVGVVVVDVTEQRAAEAERARLLANERAARHAAERSADQLARLQAVTARLSVARTTADVAEVAVAEGVRGMEAGAAILTLLTDDGAELELVRAEGQLAHVVERWSRFSVDAQVPAAHAVRTGQLVLAGTLAERDERYPVMAQYAGASKAFATAPLRVGERTYGALTFAWSDERAFTLEDRTFLWAVAEQCAQALERSRLYELEQRALRRQAFLAEATRVLASSLDAEVTLARLCRLAVPDLADLCAVHLTTDRGVHLVALAHADPAHEAALTAVGDVELPRALGLEQVIDTLLPVHRQEAGGPLPAGDAEMRSLVTAPLVASGRCLGVVSVATSGSGRRLGPADLDVVLDLAARAAVAVQHARDHRALAHVAHTLQRSLLPAARPSIPGLDVAAVYHPVSESQVGGDFYDVFPLADGRWGAVIGDVCGKGVSAASLTALARYTVRAAASGESTPSAVLHRLNDAILAESLDDRFCTLAHMFVEPGDGVATVTLACGGHPLPVLVTAAGELRPVGRPGTGIGMFPDPDVVDTVHTLGPGDALVLFTDGVLEARAPDGTFAPDLFLDALRGATGGRASDLAAAVERAVLAFEGGTARDDMAVLVVRVPLPGEEP